MRMVVKQDYYELLGLTKDADDLQIKKAFRKLALEWHPDKNSHRSEVATEHFKLLQGAYAVLSDPTERAYYDRNKDKILGQDFDSSELINVHAFYSQSAYDGMDDTERGFYTVYRKFFNKVAEEENRFNTDGVKSTFPSFGNSTTSGAEVVEFYVFWSNFTCRMHFSWDDTYDARDGSNRWVRRAMEKDNEGSRKEKRRSRTEDVRALVEFVKRRDVRYILHQQQMKKAQEQEEEERRRTQKEIKLRVEQLRQNAAEEELRMLEERDAEFRASGAYRVADDEISSKKHRMRKNKEVESAVATPNVVRLSEVMSSDDDSDDSVAGLVCEPCRKSFKSVPSLDSHLKSKKHREAMAALSNRTNKPTDGELPTANITTVFNTAEKKLVESDGSESAAISAQFSQLGLDESEKHISADFNSKEADKNESDSSHRQEKKNQGVESTAVDEAPKRKLNKTELRRLKKKEELRKPRSNAAGSTATSDHVIGEGHETKPDSRSSIKDLKNKDDSDFGESLKKISDAAIAGGARAKPMQAYNAMDGVVAAMGSGVKCGACGDIFLSRNALFSHIKKTGHALSQRDLETEINEGGIGGYGGSGGKSAAKKEKNKAKRLL